MQIDRSRFPLVFIRETENPDGDVAAELAALLAEGRQFVLISEQHSHDETHEPHEVRKARAQFFKQNKGRFREFCVAAILIEGDVPTSMPFRLAAQGVAKALGVDFHFVRDEEAAAAVGKNALARRKT
ncbi:MAG: hypothetical protein DI595_00325 [Agrobacterium fabrum]|uniref:Uncharacterized protein n=1 Tax=Agrobacterium fabrum TaxID=1176649 RepID=A0A2W5FJ16_9HYPH|nr:MAG: hypothetical protein DI595_00325 [Agrobacterium fabrum]